MSLFHITDLSKSYQSLEEKVTTIYKLSVLTLDDIIQRLAKGFEFVPPEKSNVNLADLIKEQERGVGE